MAAHPGLRDRSVEPRDRRDVELAGEDDLLRAVTVLDDDRESLVGRLGDDRSLSHRLR